MATAFSAPSAAPAPFISFCVHLCTKEGQGTSQKGYMGAGGALRGGGKGRDLPAKLWGPSCDPLLPHTGVSDGQIPDPQMLPSTSSTPRFREQLGELSVFVSLG